MRTRNKETADSPNPELNKHVRPRILERMRWIETALREGDQFPKEQYLSYFGIKEPNLSQDLNRFVEIIEIFGGEATRTHGWINVLRWPVDGCVGSIGYLDWHRLIYPDGLVEVAAKNIGFESPHICRWITSAIRSRRVVEMEYMSTTSGLRKLNISPHSLVKTAGRTHVRAYDHGKNDFRDFVISRMSQVQDIDNYRYVSSDFDDDWNEIVEVSISIESSLEDFTRKSISMSCGLDSPDKEIRISARFALVDYEVLAMGIFPSRWKPFFSYEVIRGK
jgi:hypothetical protein